MLDANSLKTILQRIRNSKVTILGDACCDIYWEADMRKSVLSREVPNYPLPIVNERYSLGAGANVASNLNALDPTSVHFVSLIGKDWRANILKELLKNEGISDSYLVESENLVTPAYIKPIKSGISSVKYEDSRLDFENRSPIPDIIEYELKRMLYKALEDSDILIVSDQFEYGCVTPGIAEMINDIGLSLPVIVDSRTKIGSYRNVIIKPNELEASICLGIPIPSSDTEIREALIGLKEMTNAPVIMTLGEKGAAFMDEDGFITADAFKLKPPIDTVGAGDSFLSAFALAYSTTAKGTKLFSKSSIADILQFGCLASAVTAKKIGCTGTASPSEMVGFIERYGNI